eukprot:m.236125 g.236125  ORF g.236125 m.236125 type:complete len:1045 (+) comp15772_c0_seq1:37-3171(+)
MLGGSVLGRGRNHPTRRVEPEQYDDVPTPSIHIRGPKRRVWIVAACLGVFSIGMIYSQLAEPQGPSSSPSIGFRRHARDLDPASRPIDVGNVTNTHGLRYSHFCLGEPGLCPYLPVPKTDNCANRMQAGPKRAADGGYSATFPRLSAVSASALTHASTWGPLGASIGGSFLGSVADIVKEHPVPVVSRDTDNYTMVRNGLRRFPDCGDLTADAVRDAAEVVVGGVVESRLWACVVLRASHGLPVRSRELGVAVGSELLFLSAEFRMLVRDVTRYVFANSHGLCQKGFGSPSTKFLAVGAVGATYLRPLRENRTNVLPQAVVKFVVLPAETGWRDVASGQAHNLSAASLAAGLDPSVESFMDEAARLFVSHGVTPHVQLGLGTWVCDNFLKVPRGVSPVTGLTPQTCAGRPRGLPHEEGFRVCKILEDVTTGVASPNLSVLTKEVAIFSAREAFIHMSQGLKKHPAAFHAAVKAFIFEVVYTLAALQQGISMFQHNDYTFQNIRTTIPAEARPFRPGVDKFAPRHRQTGLALTTTEYNVSGTLFQIPNYGYSVRVGDWGESHSSAIERLTNRRAVKVRHLPCGQRTPDARQWSSPIAVVDSITAVTRDDNIPEASCDKWAKFGRDAAAVKAAGIAPHGTLAVLRKCPFLCKSAHGVVNITVTAGAFADAALRRLTDDKKFRDERGRGCDWWSGKCDRAQCEGLSATAEATLFDRCPVSCDLAAGTSHDQRLRSQGHLLVRVAKHHAIEDGVYRAVPSWVTDGGMVNLQLQVRHRVGFDLGRINLSNAATTSTVSFYRRTWHTMFTLDPHVSAENRTFQQFTLRIARANLGQGEFEMDDILRIAENDATPTTNLRVLEVLGVVDDRLELIVRSESYGVLQFRGHASNGILYRVGRRCDALFYDRSWRATSPVFNAKFDMHLLFNNMITDMTSVDFAALPPRTGSQVRELLDGVNADLIGKFSAHTHDFRLSATDPVFRWCDQKSEWSTDDPRMVSLKTPAELLQSDYFQEFRDKPAIESLKTIARHSLEAALPPKFCIGTGEIRTK